MREIVLILSLLLLLLLLATPSWAALTNAERISLDKYKYALLQAKKAQINLSHALNEGGIPDKLVGDIAKVAHLLGDGWRFGIQGFLLVYFDIPATKNNVIKKRLEQGTRGARWRFGWDMMSEAIKSFVQARTIMKKVLLEKSTFRLRNVESHTFWAFANLRAVDKTQPLASPHHESWPQIIGPHGDFNQAVYNGLFFSMWYSQSAVKSAADVYADERGSDKARKNLADAIIFGQMIYWSALEAVYTFGNGAENERDSQFFAVVGALKPLTIRSPLAFRSMIKNVVRRWIDHPKYVVMLEKMIDSWQHMDVGVWGAIIFPDCTLTSRPDLCVGFGG